MSSKEIVNECYKKAAGNKAEFIKLLESRGFRNGYNGYLDEGNYVRVYIGAPDRYAGYGGYNA